MRPAHLRRPGPRQVRTPLAPAPEARPRGTITGLDQVRTPPGGDAPTAAAHLENRLCDIHHRDVEGPSVSPT